MRAKPSAKVTPPDEIRRELEETRRELQVLRQRYAEVYLRNKEQQAVLKAYEARLAVLLSPDETLASADLRDKVLERIGREERLRLELREGLVDFRSRLGSVLGVLGASETVRLEMDRRLDALVQQAGKQLSMEVARRGSNPANQQNLACRILDTSPELGVVILDCGSTRGIVPGLTFVSSSSSAGPGMGCRLQVIEVRPGLCAAAVVSGDIATMKPGTEFKLDR